MHKPNILRVQRDLRAVEAAIQQAETEHAREPDAPGNVVDQPAAEPRDRVEPAATAAAQELAERKDRGER